MQATRSKWFLPLFAVALGIMVLIAFVIDLAHGHSGAPHSWLGAIGGLAYTAATVVRRIGG